MLINSYVLVASLTPQAYKCSNVLVALTSAPKEHTSVFWNWTHIQHSSVAANIRWVRRIELGRVQGVEQQKEHISSSCEFRLTPKGRSFALIR